MTNASCVPRIPNMTDWMAGRKQVSKTVYKRIMSRVGVTGMAGIILCGWWTVSACCQEGFRQLRMGDRFPSLAFFNDLKEEDRPYLGLSQADSFHIQDIDADLVIIEFLNKYCFHCQVQAPIFARVHGALKTDPVLSDKVRMIGIGVGNSRHQMEKFRAEIGIQFPLVPDLDFAAYNAVGSPKTPFTVLLRRDGKGNRIVASVHRGVVYSDKDFLEEIRAVLQYDMGILSSGNLSETQQDPAIREVKPGLSEEELARKVARSMEAVSGHVFDIQKKELPHSGTIYMGSAGDEKGHLRLFAKVISRASFCDVCHDIHFIYVFDEKGALVRFDPIHLTKKGNLEWSGEDSQKIRNRVQGRSLLEAFVFDPEVDAVTSATISSHLVFLSLADGKEIYRELQKEGYLPETE